jgi:HSP20 family protein
MFDVEDVASWMKVEEFHEGDTLVVRAELPDIDPEKDIEVTAESGVVRIHGRREVKGDRKDKEGFRTEFRYGEFDREVGLPVGATADDVKATYKNGILEVRIPCPHAEATPTKVPVTQD